MSSLVTREFGWAAAVILALAYGLSLGLLSPLALQDSPAHLANAVVLADLIFHGGVRFGGMFSYHFLWVPYVLGDLGFAVLVEALGPQLGGAAWTTIVLLSVPCALIFFMRVADIAPGRRALVFILSLYLATDWFFLMGFLNFRLGLAVTIVGLALVTLLRKQWSTWLFVGYAVLVVLGYLVHLTTIAFLGMAVGVSGLLRLWQRTSNVRTEALLLAPIAALALWHFGVAVGYTLPGDPIENAYTWGPLPEKFARLSFEFFRFHRNMDLLMLAGLVVCLLVSAGRIRLQHLRESTVIEMLVLAATFVAVYAALPGGYSEAYYVDVRALAWVSLCAVLACVSLPAASSWSRGAGPAIAIVLAVALVAVNLVYVGKHLAAQRARLTQYREVVAAIPVGAHVLPVNTLGREGNIAASFHDDAFTIIDRAALMPYAFNANTANPEKYLRYVRVPYIPYESWYVEQRDACVDWQRVLRDYDYVLVQKPFVSGRIPLPTSTVAQNASAALLAIDKASAVTQLAAGSAPRAVRIDDACARLELMQRGW